MSVEPQLSSMEMSDEESVCVLNLSGELDLLSGPELDAAVARSARPTVVVDMTATTFMDCAGYRSLATAEHALQARGGSLQIRNQVGQPARLLTLLQAMTNESARETHERTLTDTE